MYKLNPQGDFGCMVQGFHPWKGRGDQRLACT